jgi:endogenous inhibitor of DNA gyrase (YacG/DUF329 family)
MKVLCPQCKNEVEYNPKNEFRPFCSERCKLIDLGDWAMEKFAVPVHEYDSSKQEKQATPPGQSYVPQDEDGFEDD